MRYQKKPVVIDAWQALTDRAGLGLPSEVIPCYNEGQWYIHDKLHDTDIKFEPGDWIIRGLKGELYPCKPDVFEASYEPVQEKS